MVACEGVCGIGYVTFYIFRIFLVECDCMGHRLCRDVSKSAWRADLTVRMCVKVNESGCKDVYEVV